MSAELRKPTTDSTRLLDLLAAHEESIRAVLAAAGITDVWIVGPLADGSARPDSTIDLLVRFEEHDHAHAADIAQQLHEITGTSFRINSDSGGESVAAASARQGGVRLDEIAATYAARSEAYYDELSRAFENGEFTVVGDIEIGPAANRKR
ncbi:hypothetical protein [Gordonia malaquae]|uniref:hypothetical protein n=1 Tax=Gordonia malaquae TaxID=410332 RepID=UPI00301AF113